jgi:outer membrane lipoprotein-sorting protein
MPHNMLKITIYCFSAAFRAAALCFLFVVSTWAQGVLGLDSASKLMEHSARYLSSAKSLSITFTVQLNMASADMQQKYKGTLIMQGADKFRVELPDLTYVANNGVLWQYSKSNNQVVIDSHSPDHSRHPSQILLQYLECAPLSIQSGSLASKPVVQIVLDPSEHIRSLDSVCVWLDTRKYVPVKILTRDLAENISIYKDIKINRDITVKKGTFTFKPPRKAEIIDKRE